MVLWHLRVLPKLEMDLFSTKQFIQHRAFLPGFFRRSGGVAGNLAVDGGPGGEGAEVAVVDVEVGGDFAAAGGDG